MPAVEISNKLDCSFGILWLKRCKSSKAFSLPEDESITVEGKILKNVRGKSVLIVDDIVDAGVTSRVARKLLGSMKPKKLKFAVLLINGRRLEKRGMKPNELAEYYGSITHGEWIVFPWEPAS